MARRHAPGAGDRSYVESLGILAASAHLRSLPQAAAIGVVWETCWPCGQSAQPKSECHRRRIPRHKARGLGLLGFDCGAGDVPLRTVASSKIGLDASDLACPEPSQKGNSYGRVREQ